MFKNYKKIKQLINGKRYNLLIADTKAKKIKGLSGIKKLPKYWGMIFPYPEAVNNRTFTMKGVCFPLMIIFLDNKMNIVYQEKAFPKQRNAVICKKPSAYVIEIPC